MSDVMNPDFKDKSNIKVPEGFPETISISGKVVCPWKSVCVGFRPGAVEQTLCINYDPKRVDFKNADLSCSHWSNPNAVPKKNNRKKVLHRRT